MSSKILERLTFNELFGFFDENDLIFLHQSGFKPGDSCINQRLSITHEIYQSFNEGLDVLSIYSVYSDTSGNLLNLLSKFLRNRKHRVVLNGPTFPWADLNARVTQGSILGPLLFLVYINDLADGLSSNVKLFADYTSAALNKKHCSKRPAYFLTVTISKESNLSQDYGLV